MKAIVRFLYDAAAVSIITAVLYAAGVGMYTLIRPNADIHQFFVMGLGVSLCNGILNAAQYAWENSRKKS